MTDQRSITNSVWLQLILLGLIWGGSFFSIAIALREIPVLTSVLHRVGWAALVLWIFVLIRGHALPRGARIWVGFLGMGVLNNVIPFTLMAWGQTHIETGLVSILNAGTAIFGVLIAALFLVDERLTRRKIIGTGLGFAGVVTVIGWQALSHLDLRSAAQLAVILGTISYGCAGVWARIMLKGLPPEVAAAGMLTSSFIIMLPIAISVDGLPNLMISGTAWAAIAYYAIVATAGAYILYYRILAAAGSANVMLVTLLIPVIAITLGAIYLGETLPPNAFAGLILIAVGLIVLDGRIVQRLFKARTTR